MPFSPLFRNDEVIGLYFCYNVLILQYGLNGMLMHTTKSLKLAPVRLTGIVESVVKLFSKTITSIGRIVTLAYLLSLRVHIFFHFFTYFSQGFR